MQSNYPIFEWINRHARFVIGAVLLAALVLGAIAPAIADSSDPNFDPEGEIFDLYTTAEETLSSDSSLSSASFIVEASGGGDVLTADALREWKAASDRIRADSEHAQHLVTRFDVDLGSEIPGVLSIVDAVDRTIPGGVETATDDQVKAALVEVLGESPGNSGLDSTLSESARVEDGIWTAPAFLAFVTYDEGTLGGETAAELWLREVQADFRENAVHTESAGIAIDFDTTFDEAVQASSPYIFLAVSLIVLVVAAVHRSYWSAVLVATGLGATMLAYNGLAALIGLKMGSLLLTFIVPIAMISFGVDFFIHGVGRVREMQVEGGMRRSRAYPAGMTALFLAMLLAASSSIVAFLANASSGTEAIVQFGIGAAIALGLAYVVLGLLMPRVLMGFEETVGANPPKGRKAILYGLGMVVMAIVGGLGVALAAVMPQIGAAAVALFGSLFVALPLWRTRRRNRRAAESGAAVSDQVKGAAHGFNAAGILVHGLAARRVITLPLVGLLGVLGIVASLNVKSGLELEDFLPANSGVVQSIETFREHFPSNGEGTSMIYAEGDLTDPATLERLDVALSLLDRSGAQFGRDPSGDLIVGPYASEAVRATMALPRAVEELARSGAELADFDGNGLPDTKSQIAAVYNYIVANGVPAPDGKLAYTAAEVAGFLATDGDADQATALVLGIGSFTDGSVINPARDAMVQAAEGLSASTDLEVVGVTGDVFTQFESLESFRNSMLVALPLAVLLTLLVAAALLRSVKYAVASVIPIGLVVTGVYAFMAIAGLSINVVTATIAAIAVGVGIDFSTHFTVRFREELQTAPDRLSAIRRAGTGTGGALALSALTSMLGFTIMALAPTPIFATFGLLTTVMIGLALFASLVVLPSLLMVVTREKAAPAEVQLDESLALAQA